MKKYLAIVVLFFIPIVCFSGVHSLLIYSEGGITGASRSVTQDQSRPSFLLINSYHGYGAEVIHWESTGWIFTSYNQVNHPREKYFDVRGDHYYKSCANCPPQILGTSYSGHGKMQVFARD